MKLKKLSALALAASLSMSAHAISLYTDGTTILEDDNMEYLVKGEGNMLANVIEVGDKLRGVLEFPTIKREGGGGIQQPVSPELTGIFETEVLSITNVVGNPNVAERIEFGVSASFAATYGANSMVALFLNNTPGGFGDVENDCAVLGIAACENRATSGSLYFTAGILDADDEWFSTDSALLFGAVAAAGSTTKVAFVNYALSVLTNNTGYQFGDTAIDCLIAGFLCSGDGKTDLVGSGDALGGAGLQGGFQARSDFDVRLNAIPEPGSLALAGLALAGLGFASRKRTRAGSV